jgi:hypothetical protein
MQEPDSYPSILVLDFAGNGVISVLLFPRTQR